MLVRICVRPDVAKPTPSVTISACPCSGKLRKPVQKTDGRADDEDEDDGDRRGNAKADQIEQADVRRADQERDREVEAAEQRDQRLPDGGAGPRKAANTSIDLMLAPERKPVDMQRRDDEHRAQHHQADESAAVVAEGAARDGGEDERRGEEERGEEVQPVERSPSRSATE